MSASWKDRDYRGWEIHKTSYGTYYAQKDIFKEEEISNSNPKFNCFGNAECSTVIVKKITLIDTIYIGDYKYGSWDKKNDLKKIIKERELKGEQDE